MFARCALRSLSHAVQHTQHTPVIRSHVRCYYAHMLLKLCRQARVCVWQDTRRRLQCTHTYTHIRIHTHTHTRTHTHIHMRTHSSHSFARHLVVLPAYHIVRRLTLAMECHSKARYIHQQHTYLSSNHIHTHTHIHTHRQTDTHTHTHAHTIQRMFSTHYHYTNTLSLESVPKYMPLSLLLSHARPYPNFHCTSHTHMLSANHLRDLPIHIIRQFHTHHTQYSRRTITRGEAANSYRRSRLSGEMLFVFGFVYTHAQ